MAYGSHPERELAELFELCLDCQVCQEKCPLFEALFSEEGLCEPLEARVQSLALMCSLCGRCTLVCPYQNGKLATKSLIRPVLAIKGRLLRQERKGLAMVFERAVFRRLPAFLDSARRFPSLSNALLANASIRRILGRFLDIDPLAPLPAFVRAKEGLPKAPEGFKGPKSLIGQKFALFDSCLTRAFYPLEAFKAKAMIEALGGEVLLIQKGCCGMVALERGLESYAKKHYQRPLLKRFQKAFEAGAKKILFLEPTCLFALRSFLEELRAFGFHKDDLELAPDFISYALPQTAPRVKPQTGAVYQPPCSHDPSMASPWLERAFAPHPLQTLEGVCCGMQGSLGFRASTRQSRERFTKRFAYELRSHKQDLWLHDCSLCRMLACSSGTQKSLSRIDLIWELCFSPNQTKEAVS